IPLDGSKTAEKVLPYARFLAGTLKLPVELLEVIDIVEIAKRLTPEKAHFLNTVVENRVRSSEQYLKRVAGTFAGANVKCTVEKGTDLAQRSHDSDLNHRRHRDAMLLQIAD